MRSHAAVAIRLTKHSLTLAAALIIGWALVPSPASAQVIERGIQGGVTGAIIGGIIGGGKGAGRGAAIGAGVGVVAGAIEADNNRQRRAYYGAPPPGVSATIRVRRMASMASARPRRSANINIPIACRSMGARRLSCSII